MSRAARLPKAATGRAVACRTMNTSGAAKLTDTILPPVTFVRLTGATSNVCLPGCVDGTTQGVQMLMWMQTLNAAP